MSPEGALRMGMMYSVRDRRRQGSEAWGRNDYDEWPQDMGTMRTREKRQWKDDVDDKG